MSLIGVLWAHHNLAFECRPKPLVYGCFQRPHASPLRFPAPFASRYTVVVGEGSAEVCGAITVRGHYFENGNIQLRTSKEVAAKTVPFSVSERANGSPKTAAVSPVSVRNR